MTNKKKLPSRNGVVILQHGDDVPIMVNAAKQAFFTLKLAELTLTAGELGVDAPGVSVPQTVTTLVQHVLSTHYKKPATEAELHQILSLRCGEEDELFKDVCDDDLLIECLENTKSKHSWITNRV